MSDGEDVRNIVAAIDRLTSAVTKITSEMGCLAVILAGAILITGTCR